MDDYLAKPFEPREILLRIGSVLRRARAAPVGKPESAVVRFGPYAFSLERGELRAGEEIVRITDREREILRLLCANAARAFRERRCRSPAERRRNERSTCSSTGCGEKSNRIRRIPPTFKLRGEPAIVWSRTDELPIVFRDLPHVRPCSQLLATRGARDGGSAAERPLQALAAHRHTADGPVADRRHFCLHAASLGTGDAAAVRGGRQRHRRADRSLQEASAGRGRLLSR